MTQQGAKEMVAAQLPGSIVNISSIIGELKQILLCEATSMKPSVVAAGVDNLINEGRTLIAMLLGCCLLTKDRKSVV